MLNFLHLKKVIFKKDVINILKSSFWNLFGTFIIILSGAILTIVAPKIFSVEDFGLWRMFILYSTYAGILHFGIPDGYLLNNVTFSRQEAFSNLAKTLPFVIIQQLLVVGLLILPLFLLIKDPQYLFIGISVLLFSITINIRTQLDNFLIIIKDFKNSNIVKILDKVIFLVALLVVFFISQIKYQEVIILYIASSLIALIVVFLLVKPHFTLSKGVFHQNINNIKMGSQLLISNIFIILLFNIDSIFVNVFMGIESFAIFAFAITIIMLINQFSESISQVFFPYLATDFREKLLNVNTLIVSTIFGLWLLILQFSFLFIPLINIVFPEYRSSESVIVIYLLTSLFTLIIRVSQNNLYKVLNLQKEFIKIESFIFMLVIFALFFSRGHMSLILVSLVILGTRAIWFIFNEIYITKSFKTVVYIVLGFLLYGLAFTALYYRLEVSLFIKFIIFFLISSPAYYKIAHAIKKK